MPITWERIGVAWDEVEEHNLPGTTPKKQYGFPLAVEAEALPPGLLRDLVNDAIRLHHDEDELATLEVAEESERHFLMAMADMAVAS